jgi:GT2 family glycosyltransferase
VNGRPVEPDNGGARDDAARVDLFLAELGLTGAEVVGGPDPTLDLSSLAQHPGLADDPDRAARVRVAAARHLWRDQPGPADPAIPPDFLDALPTPNPDADVAVIVPCRDDGPLLIDTLASLRLCAPETFHLVVVDDGSTDRATLAVLAALHAEGIVVVQQERGGRSRARNLGAKLTTAPFLLFLGADDLLRPGFATDAVRLLGQRPGVGVVHSDATYFGRRTGTWVTEPFDPVRLLTGNYLGACAVIRRQALETADGWDEDLAEGEDWELWISLAEAGWDFARLPVIGIDYRVRNGAMPSSGQDSETRVRTAVAVAAKHHMLYANHLPGVIANFTTALLALEKGPAGVRPDPASEDRALADQLAATRAELAHQAELGAVARLRSATKDPSRVAALRISTSEARARSAELRAGSAEQELAALRATRTFRWLRLPRSAYSRTVGARPRRSPPGG